MDVIADLEIEYNFIEQHHVYMNELKDIVEKQVGRFIFKRAICNHYQVLNGSAPIYYNGCYVNDIALSNSLYVLYKDNIGMQHRSRVVLRDDEYVYIDIELYKIDNDYRFQIDSAYTVEEIEYHVSRLLFHSKVAIYGYYLIEFGTYKDRDDVIKSRRKRIGLYNAP